MAEFRNPGGPDEHVRGFIRRLSRTPLAIKDEEEMYLSLEVRASSSKIELDRTVLSGPDKPSQAWAYYKCVCTPDGYFLPEMESSHGEYLTWVVGMNEGEQNDRPN